LYTIRIDVRAISTVIVTIISIRVNPVSGPSTFVLISLPEGEADFVFIRACRRQPPLTTNGVNPPPVFMNERVVIIFLFV
jgi:hypothetical protein